MNEIEEYYRLWYIDFGGAYVHKDFDNKEEAIKEAQNISIAALKWLGRVDTKLEKHTIEIIDFNR